MNRMPYLFINAFLLSVDLHISRSSWQWQSCLLVGLLVFSFVAKSVAGYYRARNIGDKSIWMRWLGCFIVLIGLSVLSRTQPAVPSALSIVVVIMMIVVLISQLQLLFLPSLINRQRHA